MSRQPRNKVAQAFKEKFEEASNIDHGWNSPPDFIFEEAIATVNNKKEKKKKRNFFFMLFSSLVLVLIFSQVLSYNKVSTLEDKINSISIKGGSQEVDHNQNSISATETAINTRPAVAQKAIEDSSTNTTTKQSIITTNSESRLTPSYSALNSASAKTSQTKEKVSSENSISKDQAISSDYTSAQNTSVTVDKPLKENNAIQTLTSVNDERLSSLALIPSIALAMIDAKKTALPELRSDLAIDIEKKNGLELTLTLIRNNSTFAMNGKFHSEQSLTKYDDFYTGSGIQLGLSLPLGNKLKWINAFSFNKIHNQSEANLDASYSKANEKADSEGMTMYETSMHLESPVGSFSQSMAFTVDPALAHEGDIISDHVKINQCLDVLSLSSGLRYDLLQKNRFTWSTDLSLGLSYISELESELKSEVSMMNHSMGTSNKTMSNANQLNKFFGFVELATDFNFAVTKDYRLHFGLGYAQSISSLRSTADGGPSTQLINWSSNVGVTKRF